MPTTTRKLTGGGTSAVAASTHASCARFRDTDPLVVGMTRRSLATLLGAPDTTAGIPVARRIRAGLFERLVRDDAFVSRVSTVTVGQLGLRRPDQVRRIDCRSDVARTRAALMQAHGWALEGDATMLAQLAIPFPGMQAYAAATPVLPDYAVVTARHDIGQKTALGSWLIMGDAKDYERVRSVISDARMLKGFLQVAMGAEAADRWSDRPADMLVHSHGTLAVPRNSFLQPTAVTEDLTDHRDEVRGRAEERADVLAQLGDVPLAEADAMEWVAHRTATFDPATCTSCALFTFCRTELRASAAAVDLLTEIGVPPVHRAVGLEVLAGQDARGRLPDPLHDQIRATASGLPVWTAARRTDPVGQPTSVELVMAKSDGAATGIHGMAIRVRVGPSETWDVTVYDDPQAPATRLSVMDRLGYALVRARVHSTGLKGPSGKGNPAVHLVVPETVTADVLVSIADSVAGVELSRLRWQRDLDQGRPALTFDGSPATLPPPLSPNQRLAVAFLLEDDRARSMLLRAATVPLTTVLQRHLVPGGAAHEQSRLDYLLAWATATGPLDHREASDNVAAAPHTPGARMANRTSDAIHDASARGQHPDPAVYRTLVTEELQAKAALVEQASTLLDGLPSSRLRDAHLMIEADAQAVWNRRVDRGAADLVRFGRTMDFWRDRHIDILEGHDTAGRMLAVMTSPALARQAADDAGNRSVAHAVVTAVDPVRVITRFRGLSDERCRTVLVTVNDQPTVEEGTVAIATQAGAFKVSNLPIAPLVEDTQTAADDSFPWVPYVAPQSPLAVGDRLVLVDYAWFPELKTAKHEVKVPRPGTDDTLAPRTTCGPASYLQNAEEHAWCCQPHTAREAQTSDWFAEQRAEGKMNPEVWPPIADDDGFDTPVPGAPTADDVADDVAADVAAELDLGLDLDDDGLTLDDLD